jgi:beta-galactosidase
VLAAALAAGCGGGREAATPAASSPALERTRTGLTAPWRFQGSDDLTGAEAVAYDDGAWTTVTVPHTWGRDRTWRRAWYRTHFDLPAPGGRSTYLVFEGVSTIADVFVNGRLAGQHRGAYTRFVIDATALVRPGDNVLAVRVSDAPQDTVDTLPSGRGKRLYLSYGGIYRKAWVVQTAPVHVDPTDHASSGVYVTPSAVSAEAARFSIRTLVRNSGATPARVKVHQSLRDADGAPAASFDGEVEVGAGARGEVTFEGTIARPRLWGPGHPHLYTVATELRAGGVVTDAVEVRTGFRDFRLEDGHFVLNGVPIALRGVGKHQETENSQTAMSDEEIREDFANLRDLGVNSVRLAHYPHASLEYDLADEMGLLVWAENGHSNTSKSTETGDHITREMVRQNYNHPSIVIWSVGNETGFVRVNRFAAVARAEDPRRLITYASNTGGKGKKRYPDLDFIAHNTYRGWYRGLPWDFEAKALETGFISENGAGAVITNHTDYADARHEVDVFEPEEFRQLMAEVQLQVVFRDHAPRIPMYLVWILRDFAIDKYKDARNTKGLMTYANFRKDAWYLYKAFLRPDTPVVHITSKTYFLRRGRADNGIKVYSNAAALDLTVNGEAQPRLANGAFRHANGRRIDNVFFWPAPLRAGRNDVAVRDAAGHEDRAILYYDGATDRAPADPLLPDLRSSNPGNRAVFIDRPVQAQWPFYSEFDGTADNTFDLVPEEVAGAGWISTGRMSKPEHRTALTFTAGAAAEVFVMGAEASALDQALRRAGFEATGRTGRWRNDALALVPYRLFGRTVAAGDRVSIPPVTADYVVLVKRKAGAR